MNFFQPWKGLGLSTKQREFYPFQKAGLYRENIPLTFADVKRGLTCEMRVSPLLRQYYVTLSSRAILR